MMKLIVCNNGANYVITKTKWISRYMLAPLDYTQTARAFVTTTKILHYIKLFNQWLRPGITLTQHRRDTRAV